MPTEADAGIEGSVLVVAAQDHFVATGLAGQFDQIADDGRPDPLALVAGADGHILNVADCPTLVNELVFQDETGRAKNLTIFRGDDGPHARRVPPAPNANSFFRRQIDDGQVGQRLQETAGKIPYFQRPKNERHCNTLPRETCRPILAHGRLPLPIQLDGTASAGVLGKLDKEISGAAPMATPSTPAVYAWEVPPTPLPNPPVEPRPAVGELERLAAGEIWREWPASKPAGGTLDPLSADWFRHLETKRYRRHGRWIPSLLELARHAGESVLAMGDGLGTEWAKLAEAGADVSVADPSADRLRLYRQHAAARGTTAHFLHAPLDHLPVGDERIDVVCGFFNDAPKIALDALAGEAFRVLRPGGKVMAVVPAYYNAARWQALSFPWRPWIRRANAAGPGLITGGDLRAAFDRFDDVRIYKRHLRRTELPHVWRWMMLPLLERMMGRFLVVKAFKPLSAAADRRAAA